MKLYDVRDKRFAVYGRILDGLDCGDMFDAAAAQRIPEQTEYIACLPSLQQCKSLEVIENEIFGGMAVQAGYCFGHNSSLDAVEYHKCSEVNAAVTDLVLLLGREQDIEPDSTYDTGRLEAFFVPAGTVMEVYGTTLHYAPCQVSEKGFGWIVILPEGTNTELGRRPEDKLLYARNKWLIAHEEAGIEGAFAGLRGENLKVILEDMERVQAR